MGFPWLIVQFLLCQFVNFVKSEDTACCVPAQFEASMLVEYGLDMVFSTSGYILYVNGTGSLAYDYTNSRALLFVNGTVRKNVPPYSQPIVTTLIYDFKAGIIYHVGEDGTCQKTSLGKNMVKPCVPGGGKEISHGFLAANQTTVLSYEFNSPGEVPLKITANLVRTDPERCLPVRIMYTPSNSVGGLMYNFELMDLKEGITNPGIFKPPRNCTNVPQNGKSATESFHPVIQFLSGS